MSLVCLNLFNCFLHQQVLVLGYNISDINFCFLLPGFFFGYEYLNSKAKPIDDGITGVLLNVIVAYVVDVFWFDRSKLHCKKLKKEKTDDEEVSSPSPVLRPQWDEPCCKRFGESPLTHTLLNEAMEGFPEPMRSATFNILIFMSVSLITPLVAEGQPLINADTGEFVSEPPIVRGLPW